MSSVFGNAILAFLESNRGGTLPDLRKFLLDASFRKEFLSSVEDPEVQYYWVKEFPLLKSNSLAPLLTRLDEFLRRKAIRSIFGQKNSKLDFGQIMDSGKIFLARLSQGLIGEENSHILGSLLVSKFHQSAIARQARGLQDRRPFFLYLDEYQSFATPTLETILSGGRKYRLALTLAHQTIHQFGRDDKIGASVLSLAGTRISFRVGDEDARKLSEGFSSFEATDIQSLENFEAICRVDRNDQDFNLRTHKPAPLPFENKVELLRQLSRNRFSTPKEEVEKELARSRAETTSQPSPKPTEPNPDAHSRPAPPPASKPVIAEKPVITSIVPSPIPTSHQFQKPEIGEVSLHESIKERIRKEAEMLDFTVQSEIHVSKGTFRADLIMSKGKHLIACEISVTTSPIEEVERAMEYSRAGFSSVALIAPNRRKQESLQESLAKQTSPEIKGRILVFLPSELILQLYEWALDNVAAAGKQPIAPGSGPKQSIQLFSEDLTFEERRKREKEMLLELSRKMRK